MQITKIPRELIQPNKWNPNQMNDKQRRALKESLSEFGEILPVIVRQVKDKYQIVDGQHRFEELEGQKEISCIVIDASDTEAMRLTQILNRTRGEDDPERLADLFADLSDRMPVEELIKGMPIDSEDEFNDLLEGLRAELPEEEDDMGGDFGGGLTDDDDVPEEVETKVKRGDIWELGRHRIMCGDSTSSDDVARLMDGKKADMVFTDPPYGVSYASKNKYLNAISRGDRIQVEIENDHLSLEDTGKLWENTFKVWHNYLAEYSSYYIASPQRGDLFLMMMMMMNENNFPLRHCLIWAKNNHVLGRCDYNYKHEPILFGWKNKHRFYGNGIFKTSVWEIPKPLKNDLHPTMKPVELIENALLNSTEAKQLCIDFFLGSGSTLIACEKTDRTCYGMEISEHYCDVIIKRWEDYTGDVAVKIN